MTKFVVSFAYTDDDGEMELDKVCFFDTYTEARAYMNKMISENIDMYFDAELSMNRWGYKIMGEGYAQEIMTIEKVEM